VAIKLVVAITDTDWFNHLRSLPDVDEVNFWAPGAASFKALQPGELFLFKLHAPFNFIVGGGIFAYANTIPVSLAWDAFGVKNGANSLAQMRARIAKYRRAARDDRSDFQIGCRILTDPFFLPRDQWIEVPQSWSPNIVTFKTFSTDDVEGRMLWEAVQASLTPGTVTATREQQRRFGQPYQTKPRLGQGAFRVLVTDNYKRRCAVSRERTLPTLDAAHIVPYGEGGGHEASNGILLRRDIHCLFDLGYVTVSPEFRFEVSGRIREDYENGRDYYALHGREVAVPDDPILRPSLRALEWHNNERFQKRSNA
jgi:putative restriction endonuclease